MNYILVYVLCTLALLIGILSLYENELLLLKQKKYFYIIDLTIIFELTIDTISFYIDGKVTNYILVYKGLKIIEFIVAPCIPMLLAKLLTSVTFWEKIREYFMLVICLNALVQLGTFFRPLMFEINHNAMYERTNFGYIYLVFITISIILLFISSRHTFIQRTTTSFTLLSTFVLIASAMIIRGVLPKSNADWLAITFAYFIFIVYFNNHFMKIDSTTALLNRNAFNAKMERLRYADSSTILVVIDANKFKEINDTYGHPCGDFAIAKIAEAIFNVYSKYGWCYRFGGDEFFVILNEEIIKEKIRKIEGFDTRKMMENLMKSLDNELEQMAEKWEYLENGVSQGYGDPFKEKMSIDEVLKNADNWMYKNKNKPLKNP